MTTALGSALRLHHVGIILPDMDDVAGFLTMMGHTEDYRGYVDRFQCWCVFCAAPEGSAQVELVVPTGGSLARFNKGSGGVHHYAYETPDIRAVQATLAEQGVRMLEDEPVKGAGTFLCNFVHPVATRGIMIEYVQPL
ncbi:VOC family protein [uncultured Rhodospira sp.]|uniref:VOC family protein n=1 Tax=uncultured Rhodospira sp. TaxID=1936189 RepID=UPI002628F7E6|nr:VOC family protein [uncultured Rhodospira sp.]